MNADGFGDFIYAALAQCGRAPDWKSGKPTLNNRKAEPIIMKKNKIYKDKTIQNVI